MSEPAPTGLKAAPAIDLLPLALLFLIGTAWGVAVSLAKFAITNGYGPFNYVVWVMLGASLISLCICTARRRLPRLAPAHLRYYAVIGGLHIAGYHFVWFTVVEHIPAGVMSVIIGSTPITTYALCLALGMERFAAIRLAGIACGLAGFVLFVAPGRSLPDPAMAGWVALGLCAPVMYAVANVLIVRLRPANCDSGALSAGTLAVGAFLTVPVSIATGQFDPPWPPFTPADHAMFGHMVIGGVGFALMIELVRLGGPTFASQLTYVMALTGVIVGMLMFGESPGVWAWLATAMVLVGVALVNSRQARNGPPG